VAATRRRERPPFLPLISLLALFQLAAVVSGHAFLIDTDPQAGSRLGAPPEEILLRFSEPIVAGTEGLSLRNADGEPVELASVAPINGDLWVRGDPASLEEGAYRASWQVMADDSHVSAGEFAFAVGDAGTVSSASTSSSGTVAWPETLGSVLLLFGLVLAIGGLASERFVWQPVDRALGLGLPRAPLVASLLLALAGSAVHVALLVGARAPSGLDGYLDPLVWLSALSTRPGLLSAITLVLLLYALWLALWSIRMPRLRLWTIFPLLSVVTAVAFRSHAATAGAWWVALVNALHLLLAGLWIGALLHLGQVLWTARSEGVLPVLARAAQRYASLALVLVPPLLLAGVVTALAVVDRPADLVTTTYGRLLLAKLLVVLAVLAVALVARLRALRPFLPDLLRRLTRIEGAALLLVVAVSAVLANAAPPQPRAADLEELLGPAPLTGPVLRLADLAGQLALFLAAAEDQLQLRVVEPSGEPAQGAELEITGTRPDGLGFDLYPRSCGPGCFSMDLAWQEGATALAVALSHESWTGGEAEFEVPWPPGQEASARLEEVIDVMGSIPSFTMTEEVSSGPRATSSAGSFQMPNPFFIKEEVYANGGAVDVRALPGSEPEITQLVLYLPGSFMWYRLWVDSQNRLTRELIVNPGHRIERTFSYDDEPAD
jgi:copper transport protein